MKPFVYEQLPGRTVFGPGSLARLPDEIARLAAARVLVLCTPEQRAQAEHARDAIGAACVGIHDRAAMHVPVEVADEAAEEALRLDAQLTVAIGGGSTIGLGKAIALRGDLPMIAVPTTYAGSEMTPVYGLTADGVKKTGRDARVLPKTVIYDPELTLTLPIPLSIASGLNAIAHAVEALYARDVNPLTTLMAEEAIRAMASGLRRLGAAPHDLDARSDCLLGASLCGAVFAAVGGALHHKLCHTLGGSFDLPHAETHAVVLPHVVAYNAPDTQDAMARIARAWRRRCGDRAVRLRPGARRAGEPRVAGDAGTRPRARGRVRDRLALLEPAACRSRGDRRHPLVCLPRRAAAARHPLNAAAAATPTMRNLDEHNITEAVLQSFAGTPDARLKEIVSSFVRHLHAFVREVGLTEDEWKTGIDFLTATGQKCNEVRQEFILLSDVLGVSQLVVSQNHTRANGITEQTVFGPFHVHGAPELRNGADVARGASGFPCRVQARVVADGVPVEGAVVDTWQSDGDGFYDVQDAAWTPEAMRLRAVFRTGADGRVAFRTVLPSSYPIPTDGPVGALLDATGRHPMRPAHIHFMVRHPRYDTLITHVFVDDDPYLESDAVFGVRNSCVGDYVRHESETSSGVAPHYTLDHEFVLSRAIR